MDRAIDPNEYLNRWTLIVGEVNTGKTTLSRLILEAFCEKGLGPQAAVIDLAPEMPAESGERWPGVGGRLIPPAEAGVLYLSARLRPPRLSTKTEEEALALARENLIAAEALFTELPRSQRRILFLNDITLYLQAGRADKVLRGLEPFKTVVANGYYGERLGSGVLSRREGAEMEGLIERFEKVVRL